MTERPVAQRRAAPYIQAMRILASSIALILAAPAAVAAPAVTAPAALPAAAAPGAMPQEEAAPQEEDWRVKRTEKEIVFVAALRDALATRIAAEREKAGLRPLAVDPVLARAAQGHTDDMIALNFRSHTDPDGRGPADRVRALKSDHAGEIAEVIAIWGVDMMDLIELEPKLVADALVESWLARDRQRGDLLNPSARRMGLGLGVFRSRAIATVTLSTAGG